MSDLPLPAKCDYPGCDCDGTLSIGPGCHPAAPVHVLITGDVLTLECALCGAIAERFRVTGVVAEL